MGLYLLYPMLYRITLRCPFLAVRTGLEPDIAHSLIIRLLQRPKFFL